MIDGATGTPLGTLDTGAGVDNLEYDPATKLLYIAAAKAARLSIVSIDDKGQPSITASATTAEGARNAVVDANGTIYIADPKSARLLVFERATPIP